MELEIDLTYPHIIRILVLESELVTRPVVRFQQTIFSTLQSRHFYFITSKTLSELRSEPATRAIMWELARKWSVLLVAVCVVLSLGNHKGEPGKDDYPFLEYDFYRDSCPQAEKIIRTTVRDLFNVRPNVAPQLLRLVFHDCFIQGCDASLLLDAIDEIDSEKDAPPNHSLKGFHLIHTIKSKLEEVCPVTVSCADILALAAREGVVLAGGPFYRLKTGRRDSKLAFREIASYELPSPDTSISFIRESFSKRGFDEREIVSLLGAHTIGGVHCKFFENRLYDYLGTGRPDPSIEPEFLDVMRSRCRLKPSNSSTVMGLMAMNYEQASQSSFGTQYFQSLQLGRGILHVDQQLMSCEGTRRWVHAYAADRYLFRKNFALSMTKLSSLHVLTPPLGQIRHNCSRIVV
ncbi:hypothetical protein NE237_026023 [Protea cynaroides]|uniref:Peroxidase n=1 Tax=Protea cynaroides TaxID=273540 RepID=A0A9Q0H2Z0_9MAGN|nr:hypothetical protein NE237_026023 [Protea cynaroides]